MALQHAVQNQHGDESVGAVVDDRQVFGADHFRPAPGAAVVRAPVVHPRVGDRELGAADVQDEGNAAFRQDGPDGFVERMARGSPARRFRRNPHCAQAEADCAFDFLKGFVRIVQRHHGDADEPGIGSAELSHGTVVSPGCAVAQAGSGRGEDGAGAKRGEDHLPPEAQLVQRLAALLAAERAQGIVPLRAAGEVLAKGGQLRPPAWAVAATARVGGRIEEARQDSEHRREFVANVRLGVRGQEVRQLHQMAVSIIDQPRSSVGHCRGS